MQESTCEALGFAVKRIGLEALYEAANVLLSRITRFSKLKRWGIVAKRRGSKRAKVALAARSQ
jgi:hypothetical protein